MATRILVQPAEDYFVAFLSTRGINVSIDHPNVIHFFGPSQREARKLVKDHDPDLMVIHNPKAFNLDYNFPFVLDEVHNDRDIYKSRQVSTNAVDLARLHYQSLGLERSVFDCYEDKPKKEKSSIRSEVVGKVYQAMMWD